MAKMQSSANHSYEPNQLRPYCRESVWLAEGGWYFNSLGATNGTAGSASLRWRGTGLYSSHLSWHWPNSVPLPARVSQPAIRKEQSELGHIRKLAGLDASVVENGSGH